MQELDFLLSQSDDEEYCHRGHWFSQFTSTRSIDNTNYGTRLVVHSILGLGAETITKQKLNEKTFTKETTYNRTLKSNTMVATTPRIQSSSPSTTTNSNSNTKTNVNVGADPSGLCFAHYVVNVLASTSSSSSSSSS